MFHHSLYNLDMPNLLVCSQSPCMLGDTKWRDQTSHQCQWWSRCTQPVSHPSTLHCTTFSPACISALETSMPHIQAFRLMVQAFHTCCAQPSVSSSYGPWFGLLATFMAVSISQASISGQHVSLCSSTWRSAGAEGFSRTCSEMFILKLVVSISHGLEGLAGLRLGASIPDCPVVSVARHNPSTCSKTSSVRWLVWTREWTQWKDLVRYFSLCYLSHCQYH